MTFQEAVDFAKNNIIPHVLTGSVVSASNRYERIRIEQPDSEGKLSIWTEYSPQSYEALKITGPMKS